jgi:hypothetical protein
VESGHDHLYRIDRGETRLVQEYDRPGHRPERRRDPVARVADDLLEIERREEEDREDPEIDSVDLPQRRTRRRIVFQRPACANGLFDLGLREPELQILECGLVLRNPPPFDRS